MNVANDLSVQPDVPVVILNCRLPAIIAVFVVTPDVSPISTVEKSVEASVVPFQTAIISPALALVPFVAVYLKKADVYEPVACVNKLLDPTIDEATLA